MTRFEHIGCLVVVLTSFLFLSCKSSYGALSISAPSPFLASFHDHEKIEVHDVIGDLAITVKDPMILYISGVHRKKNVVTFFANRLAGGNTEITLSDDSGAYFNVKVDINGCSWPTPQFSVIGPLNVPALGLLTIDVPSSLDQGEEANQKKGFSRSIFVSVPKSEAPGGDKILGQYRVRVFSADGSEVFSVLNVLNSKELRMLIGGAAKGNLNYFKSKIDGLQNNVTYGVQFWLPGSTCQPQIGGGGLLF